jgi:hypothetical protein
MPKLIKIYGERNTNTKYLSQLVRLNLEARELPGVIPPGIQRMQGLVPGREWLRDVYFHFTYPYNLGWKHTRVKPVEVLMNYKSVRDNGLAILTVTKNPYAWLLSLYRNPYHQYGNRVVNFEDFVQSPWRTVLRDNTERILENPVQLWNIKNGAYLNLPEVVALNTTSEAVLEDPASIIDEMACRFSISRLSRQFVDYVQSTTEAGKSREFYRDYYLGERWRDEISGDAIAAINRFVDRQIMRRFGYRELA